MKKILAISLFIALLFSFTSSVFASDDGGNEENFAVSADEVCKGVKSAVLMEASTGDIIYEKNSEEGLPPASVTKIMTLLLVAEALENGSISKDQTVTVSAEASSKGGSQVFISEGEEFTVEELLKCAVIASANDASVALAELIGGSESSFVEMMNDRAEGLGLSATKFENCTGLDDTVSEHVTSARDIAIMSRELIKYPIITKYSSTWQDSIRDGKFVLTNTNRLVRYYKGCNGLKTGSTDKAGFCLSATAEREGMELIAVVMGADTRDIRNNCARGLLDLGFSGYALYNDPATELERAPVIKGRSEAVSLRKDDFSYLCKRSDLKSIEKKYTIPECVKAPFDKDIACGRVEYYLNGEKIGECKIYPSESCEAVKFSDVLIATVTALLTGS